MDETKARVVDLDLNDILPNRFQPRIKFNEDSIIELSESIKEHGVIQPIIVRPIGDKYEIIAGERRYKASVLAGKDTIPAIISEINDKDSAEIALIENVQRRDLTPIEEAISYKRILDMSYLTQEQLAIKLGKSQSAVANKIRLLNLCDEVQAALMDEKISERHARSLLKLKEASKQRELLDRIIKERLTVRKTEEEIEKMNTFITEPIEETPVDMQATGNIFSPTNPGFVDVDKIKDQATEVVPENKAVDFSALLMPQQSAAPLAPSAPSTPAMPTNPASPVSSVVSNPVAPSTNNGAAPSVTGMPTNPIVEQPTIASNSMMGNVPNGIPSQPVQNPFVFDQNGVVIEEKPLNMADLMATQTQREAQVMEDALREPEQPVPMGTTIATSTPIPSAPVMPSVPNIPSVPSIAVPSPSTPVEPAIPTASVTPAPVAPAPEPVVPSIFGNSPMPTTPISEQQLPNSFVNIPEQDEEPEGETPVVPPVEESNPEPSQPTKAEEKTPIQPIIITDYEKQYDPILPPSAAPVAKIDFKEIINLIRQLNDTIEQCGYTVDTEEYDLENEYQVIIKIEKN